MRLLLTVLLVAIVGAPSPADAALITFQYHGVVNSVDADLSGTFALGDPLLVTYIFDSLTPDAIPADPVRAIYSAITSITVSVGSYSASGPGAGPHRGIDVFNNLLVPLASDLYNVFASVSGPPVAGLEPIIFHFSLFDPTANVFGDKSLPLSQPDVTAFASKLFYLEFSNGEQSAFVRGELVPAAEPVPEPGSLALLASALGASIGLRRRTSHRQP
jgi:hypothetical protein